jgi:monoamine oxidase
MNALPTHEPYEILIIGAGAAGLAAGRKLHDAGRRILILEARNRIGGRVWTEQSFAPGPVELGAEFIHGENVMTHHLVKAAGFQYETNSQTVHGAIESGWRAASECGA